MIKLEEENKFRANFDAVEGEIKTSVEDMKETYGRVIDKEFNRNPSSDLFYATKQEENKTQAMYPLLLLRNVVSKRTMENIVIELEKLNKLIQSQVKQYNESMPNTGSTSVSTDNGLYYSGMQVNLYVMVNNKATYWKPIELTTQVLKVLDEFLVDYDFYVSKGNKIEIDRSLLINPDEFNPLILPKEPPIDYSALSAQAVSESVPLEELEKHRHLIESIQSGIVNTSIHQADVNDLLKPKENEQTGEDDEEPMEETAKENEYSQNSLSESQPEDESAQVHKTDVKALTFGGE